ncbi:hypothetical protein HS048_23165 [Planomonospora sp. ID91781]|nr:MULTISPECIES: hypothetical protein [Planomonospora]MBG0823624.1 hypothetical protein [Planomonospora sp. ID91781]
MSHDVSDLSGEQAAVFPAVSRLESNADGPRHLRQVAQEARLEPERTVQALDQLTGELGLVVAMDGPWHPDFGPFYRVQSLR